MSQKKNPKGSVVVVAIRGRLRIQLPRQLYGGKQKYLSLGLPDTPLNRKAATGKANAIAADIAFERFDFTLEKYRSPSQTLPKNNLWEIWQQYTQFKQQHLAPSSLKVFKRISGHLQRMPYTQLDRAQQIRNYLESNLTQDTARRVLVNLNACCNWAVEREIIAENPFATMRRLKRVKRSAIDPFSVQERDLILQGFEESEVYGYYAPFVRFLFLTGCRLSEAIALQWGHIDPALTAITFSEAVVEGIRKSTKTDKVRKFPVNDSLGRLLSSQRPGSPESPVFVSKQGKVIDAHSFSYRAWKGVLGAISVRYRKAYNTRHTFCTLCLEAGIPIAQVAAWVGNSPEIILKHYAGLTRCQVPEL